MLRQLRSAEKMKRVLWIGLLIIIIPSFVAFVGSSDLSTVVAKDGTVSAATIDYPETGKREISATDLNLAESVLKNRLVEYAQRDGVQLDASALSEIADPKAVLDEAINLDILRQFGEQHGMNVTAQDVVAQIQSQSTAEQRRQFQQQLEQQGQTIDSYIQRQQVGQLLDMIMGTISADSRVTYFEAWQAYQAEKEQLVAEYLRFNGADYRTSVTVTEEALGKFFTENSDQFRVPDQVQYSYVMVSRDDLKSSITLTDDQITSHYNNNQEEYRLPRKAEVRQVFLKLPSPQDLNTTSAAELTSITEGVRARAEDIYQRAAKGEDFAALANQFSEETNFPPRADAGTSATDNQTSAGGYLGLIAENAVKNWYGEEWTSSVFNLAPGSISRPISTPSGFYVAKVDRIVEGDVQPLDAVRTVIEEKVREELVGPLFEKAGQNMMQAAEKFSGLRQIAEATSTTVKQTPKVNEGEQFIQGIGMLGEFTEAISDLQAGGRSDVLSDDQKHLVIEVAEEFPAHLPKLEDARPRVEAAYKEAKAREMAQQAANDVLAKSANPDAFHSAVAALGTTVTRSRPFTRPEAGTIFGAVPDFNEQTSSTRKGDIGMFATGPEDRRQGYVVWHVTETVEPSRSEFAVHLSDTVDRLVRVKRDTMILEFLRQRREQLKDRITLSEDFK